MRDFLNPSNFIDEVSEWHSLLLGFFSVVTGADFWKQNERLKDIVYNDAWYYGLGRYLSITIIILILYVLIRSLV